MFAELLPKGPKQRTLTLFKSDNSKANTKSQDLSIKEAIQNYFNASAKLPKELQEFSIDKTSKSKSKETNPLKVLEALENLFKSPHVELNTELANLTLKLIKL